MQEQLLVKMQEELKNLKELKDLLLRRINTHPSGKLHIMVKNKKYVQFYEYDSEKRGKYPAGKYISKGSIQKAVLLAQKDYEEDYYSNTCRRIDVLEKAISEYLATSENNMLNSYHPEKVKMITPIYLSDDDFIEKWYKSTPGSQNTFPYKTEYKTNRGEIVRSKSEKIIADYLYSKGIPYVYEPRVNLNGKESVYPDFAVLNVSKRKEFYFEHFGQMGEVGYSSDMCHKLMKYTKCGYYIGEKVIFTCESSENRFDVDMLEAIVNTYLI